MLYKYKVVILDENGDEREAWSYMKKSEIANDYCIPHYMVDKLIKMSNTEDYPHYVAPKRDPHFIYKDIVKSMRIYLIKPVLHPHIQTVDTTETSEDV
jgi:hypothetical protein